MQAAKRPIRRYTEDGAELWFAPEDGVSVRIASARTAAFRRRVPRVVMFGITNRCNLACSFCSRDASLPSAWTVDSAASILEELAAEGVLEVAFGGGEPFLFQGFDVLVNRLRATTPLALSVTTNGTAITRARWPRYAGVFGVVRLSVYPEVDLFGEDGAATVLREAGQRWGANLLVDDSSLDALPGQLVALAAAGAADVSILSYIGVGKPISLGPPGAGAGAGARQRLAQIVAASPIPCRLSVCLGGSVPVHRLWDGATRDGDCGAGVDFVSLLPDRTMAACSFQDAIPSLAKPVSSARDVLATYVVERLALSLPSPRSGCLRNERNELSEEPAPAPRPNVSIWQGFSGNNSGECVLAATFADETDAKAYLARLLPTYEPEIDYPEAWQEVFAAEKISVPSYEEEGISPRQTPETLGQIGATVFAVGYGLDDVFPELRALAYRKRATVHPGGMHVHGTPFLVAAVATASRGDAHAALRVANEKGFGAYPFGKVLFLADPLAYDIDDLAARVSAVAAGRPVAAAYVADGSPTLAAEIPDVLKRLGDRPKRAPRTVVSFSEWPAPTEKGDEAVARFVRWLGDERHERVASQLWFPTYRGTSRIAVEALRRGARVESFSGEALLLYVHIFAAWHAPRTPEFRARLAASVEAVRRLLPDFGLTVEERGLRVTFASTKPAATVQPLAAIARAHQFGFRVGVREAEPLHVALGGLLDALAARGR